MPFGYGDYLRKKGYKDLTIDEHIRQLEYFFIYLDFYYKKQKELAEIVPSDIKNYLAYKKSQGLQTSTINKIISVIRNFFDYAWTINAVAVDPAQKIRYEMIEHKEIESLEFQDILHIQENIISADMQLKRKVIFILAVNGLRPDEYQITKDQIITEDDSVRIFIAKANHERIIQISGSAADVLKDYLISTKDDHYLLSSKSRDGKEKPIERMTISLNLKKVSEYAALEETLTTNVIRRAYALHLLKSETYEAAAESLGIDKISLMKLVSTKD